MGLPCRIGDYTDFYTSIHHATTVGTQFRPDNPLLPNYKWVPIGYHGRASSIGVSGRDVPPAARPVQGPRRRSAELRPEPAPRLRARARHLRRAAATRRAIRSRSSEAERMCSALRCSTTGARATSRRWEYQPLGPFLSKNFASTLSPWIVTLEALAPFRAPFTRPEGDPAPLPYLDSPATAKPARSTSRWKSGCRPRRCARRACAATPVRSNFRDAYWTMAQLVTHHTVNGCNLQPGDLFGSGTHSGPGTRPGRLAAGARRRRQAAAAPCQRRDAQLPRGRRHGDPARLLRARGLAPHRLRRLPGTVAPARIDLEPCCASSTTW